MFFKKSSEDSAEWKSYYELDNHRGQISKGNIRIQVTTDERIYFYIIDRETLLPELENVMNNFMGCSQMLVGLKVRFAITYKQNEQDFNIWSRRYYHNFKVKLTNTDLEGAVGANLPLSQQYVIGHGHELTVEDINRVVPVYKVSTNIEAQPRDHACDLDEFCSDVKEICHIGVSPDELRMGVCIGARQLRD